LHIINHFYTLLIQISWGFGVLGLVEPITPFGLGLAGEPTPSPESSAKRTRTEFEGFISKEDVDLMYEA